MGPSKGTHTSTSTNKGYTTGGDRTIRSSDNVDFKVHSVILSLASPILSDLLSAHDRGDVVTLSQTAEAVKLLLDFVYPRSLLTINSFEMLNHGLLVAEKYQLDDMQDRLRSMLFLQGSPVSVFENPLTVLGVATAHKFEKEAEFAASLVLKSGNTMPNDVLKLVTATPSISPLVKVVGAALGRNAMLADVLFKFHEPPMTWVGQHCYDFLCPTCQNIYHNQQRYGAPEWLARWAYWAFQELISRPMSQCDTVFTYEFYQIALSQGAIPVPTDSCGCFKRYASDEERFEKWAAGVRKELEKRLGELDVLDLLKRSQLAPRQMLP